MVVVVDTVPPRAFAPLFSLERARLLQLLGDLGPAEWRRPTPCPGWSVLGLSVHLLGDDLSLLAWQRDDHRGTPAPDGLDERGFIGWLDQLQTEWVDAARRLSPRLVVDLLEWTDEQVVGTIAAQQPTAATAHVSWASAGPVPAWLDHARELSERWIHRQQLLQALDRPSDLRADLAEPVLDGLRWAYPHGLAALRRPLGTTVTVTISGPELARRWFVVADGDRWEFRSSPADEPTAGIEMTTEQAWRSLSNNLVVDEHGDVSTFGDAEIGAALRRARGIIGAPK